MTAEQEAPPRWGMPDALICFGAGLVGGQLLVAIAIGFGASIDSLVVTAAGLVGLWLGLLVSLRFVSRSKGAGSFAVDFGLRFERGRDLIGVPVGIGFQLLVVPLLYIPIARFVSDLSDRLEAPARQLSDQATRGGGVVLLAVLVVAGAPVVEELFYRGLVLRSVQRRFGSRVAIGASAVAFAAAHFELLQFPALLALGVLLGYLAVRYDRLGPGIFAHAGFNALTMAILIATR